ncbi:hypothetical protein [Xanthomonas oryzae]|uniref:hypothetical protein n=1 Tax=Xanthomonas oryzae TaxID=347 RepID=UPI0005A6C0BF|nr:hypothetical protein [Xanthomonas oryzae]AXM21168.1 hypothetical protein BRM88_12335 [Xanthomonas oryzae pv. oryzae]AXQ09478.1 hypothetical protein BCR61_12725 [Xanthomonas oryzae pv. oryzae]MDI9069323.1 hypothetical protein [Xanthomonas oryzae pv. oryzae]MDI9079744.1 hypothetical protein [Xanthomonas oryzae pv. oryzae]MDI9103820.1 hypothetical protein [Xanthomonas oryzae pv. oryzae]
MLLYLLDPIRGGIGGQNTPSPRSWCHLSQLRQRVLAVLGAAPIDGVGDCLIGRVRTGKAVVDQVIGDDG